MSLTITEPTEDQTLLTDQGARVAIRWLDRDEAVLTLDADPAGTGARRAGGLMREALAQARRHHVRSARTVLDIARPVCGFVLEALRSSRDTESVEMRRAGSSVVVTVALRP